jgi:hypothetical protein
LLSGRLKNLFRNLEDLAVIKTRVDLDLLFGERVEIKARVLSFSLSFLFATILVRTTPHILIECLLDGRRLLLICNRVEFLRSLILKSVDVLCGASRLCLRHLLLKFPQELENLLIVVVLTASLRGPYLSFALRACSF